MYPASVLRPFYHFALGDCMLRRLLRWILIMPKSVTTDELSQRVRCEKTGATLLLNCSSFFDPYSDGW